MPDPPAGPTTTTFEREALVHLGEVHRYARALAGDDATAEDLVQDTFLLALRSWHTYQTGTNCRAWLFTICRNQWHRRWARESRIEATADADLESLASAAIQAGLADADPAGRFYDAPELMDVVHQELDRLPPEFREVVVLADIEDLSYERIAATLGVARGTVKSRLFRGRRLLQERLVAYARDAGLIAEPKEIT